jgi:radical SAM superfamily enzyme YgiQ (UPF0313 family)
MKVLLTCTSIEDKERIENAHDSHYPLGLAYLQSYLKKYTDYEVQTHFLNNVSQEICLNKIKEEIDIFKPDVIGISVMSFSRTSSYRMIEYLDEHHPDIKIVLGGMHPTIMWDTILKKYTTPVVVVGEGELTFADLLEHFKHEKPIKDVKGIAYHNGEKPVVTASRDLIKDLNILPAPDHSIFLWEGKTVANLLTSRGCPFKCNFCVLDHISLRTVRIRSAENVCDEIEQILAARPSIKIIWLHDDAFMINKKTTIALCREIIRRGIKTSFTCSARFRPVSRELVQLMEKAGFNHVLFGLESGAQKIMDDMKKGVTKDHIRYATSLFAESNIKTTAFLIVGLPGETQETINETIDFVQEMQFNNYLYYDDIGICGIYPGAEVYNIAKRKKFEIPGYGLLDDDYWLTDGEVPYYECEHSIEKLKQWKEDIRGAIALNRIMKPEQFLLQKKMLPSIIKYSYKFGLPGIIDLTQQTLQKHNLVQEMVHTFFTSSPSKMMPKIGLSVEKELLRQVMSPMDVEEKKIFIEKWEIQSKADREQTFRWRKQRVAATDEYIRPKDRTKNKELLIGNETPT